MFGALVTRPDTNHRISDIPLHPSPTQHRLRGPAVEPLGMFCGNTALQGSAGGPLAPGGLISTEQRYTPRGGRRHVVPVGSDGWEKVLVRSASEMDEFCLHIRNEVTFLMINVYATFFQLLCLICSNEFSTESCEISRK